MSIFGSSVAIVLAIVACVAGAPAVQGGNQPFEETIYSSPELAEAQARYYDKIEWESRHRRSDDKESRNLDHIGGGNLLRDVYHRNLDHIGGGNLLRSTKSKSDRLPNENNRFESKPVSRTNRHGVTDNDDLQLNTGHLTGDLIDNQASDKYQQSRYSRSAMNAMRLNEPRFYNQADFTDGSDLQMNLDHVAGDILGNTEFDKYEQSRRTRSATGSNYASSLLKDNVDYNGGRPDFQNYETIMHRGFARPGRSTLDSLSGLTFGGSKRFNDLNAKRRYDAMIQRYLESYGQTARNMEVGEKRNFDEIDRSDFNSFVKRDVNENGNQHLLQHLNLDELALAGLGSRSYERRHNANDYLATTRR